MFKFRRNIGCFLIYCFISISTTTAQTELCFNGIDDDGDGLVDCFDSDCFESEYCDGFYYGPESPCTDRPEVQHNFTMKLQWQTNDAYFIDQRCNAFVGDMDGDGDPEIVSKTGSGDPYIRIFDGKTGEIKQNIQSITSHPFSEPVIGDVDGNGKGDIFIVGTGGALARFEYGNPNPIWVKFAPDATAHIATTPQLADFNGDGYPEIYVGNRIFDANNGTRYTVSTTLNTGVQGNINDRYSLAYDIFKPGDPKPNGGFFSSEAEGLELVIGNQVLLVDLGNESPDGGRLTIAAEITGPNIQDGFTSIADINKDSKPDIVVTSLGIIYAWNPYNQSIIARPLAINATGATGRACIGNFDNDDQIELAAVSRNKLTVFDININSKSFVTKWTKTVDDNSSMTTCTLFDFNGDSKNEVVYSDQEFLYILNGENGSELAKVVCRSGTRTEYPVIADVDADGHADIVMTTQNINGPVNSRQSYIRLYKSIENNWMPTRKVWNQHGYFITNVNDDLTIPAQQQMHVAGSLNNIFNGFLMQLSPKDINGDPIQPIPDLYAATIETDNSNCPESILLFVNIENTGQSPFPIGLPISIYKGNPTTDPLAILLETRNLPIAIVQGTSENALFTIDNIIGLPADIYVVLNDNGNLIIPFDLNDLSNNNTIECDYENNLIHLEISCTELCDNNMDDDNDGLIDCEDPDCIVESFIDTTICSIMPFEFNGLSIDETGIYYDTLLSITGCDSLITLDILVNENQFHTINRDICDNETYEFNGQLLSINGTFSDTLIAKNGCDSFIILNLNVFPTKFVAISQQICEGDSYLFANKSLTRAGVYVDTLKTINNCDSIIELELSIAPKYELFIEAEICQGSSYLFGDETYTVAGIYQLKLQTIDNCDSIVNLNLKISDPIVATLHENICAGDVFLFGQDILTETGDYSQIFKTPKNCDSLVLLALEVQEQITINQNKSICEGNSYSFDGKTLFEAGIYKSQNLSEAGCDSVTILNLKVNPIVYMSISKTICDGEAYELGGKLYKDEGVFEHIFESSTGCDSIIQLTIAIDPSYQTIIEKSLCDDDIFIFDGETYNSTGTYRIVYQATSLCDSIFTIIIKKGNSNIAEISKDICEGETIIFNNKNYTKTGNYVHTLSNESGCDSIIILHLVVNENIITHYPIDVCFGNTFEIWGENHDQSGQYEHHLTSQAGCDSLIILDLNIQQKLETTVDKVICKGSTYSADGHVFSEIGAYEYTVLTNLGCDSTIYLNLDISPSSLEENSSIICEGESVTIGTENFSKTGSFEVTLSNVYGCDSIILMDLLVNPTFHTPFARSICEKDTFFYETMSFTANGVYEIPLKTIHGCDSIIELSLEVFPTPPLEITGLKTYCKGDFLIISATKNYENYEWNDGTQSAVITTNQAGQFSVTVTDEHDCQNDTTIYVDPPIRLNAEFNFHPPFCIGDSDGEISIENITGGKAPYIVSFDGENYEGQLQFSNLEAGYYPIILSDGNKCIWDTLIELRAPINIEINLENEIELSIGDSIQLHLSLNFEPKYISWSPETGLSCTDCLNPYVSSLDDISYTVTMYDQNGCLAENELELKIINNHNIYIPSVFSPNFDGFNDVFTIYSDVKIKEIEILQIYDRWGNLVFTQNHFPANQIQFGWDGVFNNEYMNSGVFTYYCIVVHLDGESELFKGDITLIK